MTIDNIDVTATLERVKKLLADDKTMSDMTRSLMEVLVLIITLMANRLSLSSRKDHPGPGYARITQVRDTPAPTPLFSFHCVIFSRWHNQRRRNNGRSRGLSV